ncbi:MAG TPA: iron-containing alcohol dehydrogenase, partial [Spirochaetia bacterium]|nr:iron-containing alcohol dehydrogenase [Spirochaetia bacterium]
ARLLGEDVSDATATEAPLRAIEALRRVIASLGLPTRLREFDLSLDEMLGVIIKEGIQNVDDIRMRMNASMAGMLMGLGLSTSRQGIGAALSYAINARFMAPKSWVSTILLPAVMEFAVNVRGDRIAQIARLLGEDVSDATSVEAPMRAIEALRRVISSLGLPTRLREFDLSLDEMIEVAGAARSFDMMNYLPRVVSTEDIYELIKSAF